MPINPFVAMRCMHLSIDESRKRVTLCIIAALECREHYLSIIVVLQSHFRRSGDEPNMAPAQRKLANGS